MHRNLEHIQPAAAHNIDVRHIQSLFFPPAPVGHPRCNKSSRWKNQRALFSHSLSADIPFRRSAGPTVSRSNIPGPVIIWTPIAKNRSVAREMIARVLRCRRRCSRRALLIKFLSTVRHNVRLRPGRKPRYCPRGNYPLDPNINDSPISDTVMSRFCTYITYFLHVTCTLVAGHPGQLALDIGFAERDPFIVLLAVIILSKRQEVCL